MLKSKNIIRHEGSPYKKLRRILPILLTRLLILLIVIVIVTETLQKFETAQIVFYSLYLIAYSL